MLPFDAADDDIQLMLRVKLGDRSSFATLLEKHQLAVQGFLYRRVRNRAIAEELGKRPANRSSRDAPTPCIMIE